MLRCSLKVCLQYSGKENENLEGIIDENVTNLINLLQTKYLSTNDEYRPVEFSVKSQYFTTDIISHLAFGKPFGDVKGDRDHYSYIQTTREALTMAMVLTVYPWIMNVFRSPLLRGLLPSDKDVLGMGKVMRWAYDILFILSSWVLTEFGMLTYLVLQRKWLGRGLIMITR
jgi:hypothetical protein